MFRALFLLFFGIVTGVVGYQIGVATTATASAGTVVVLGGLPGIGTFLFLFFLLMIGTAVMGGHRRRAWMHGGRGWGHGPAGADDPRRQWVAEMHRTLHEAEAAGTTPAPGAGAPTA